MSAGFAPFRPRRARLVRLAAVLACAALAAPPAAFAQAAAPAGDKIVLVSTSDVKGKTVPCGCHIPKGGLARRAAYVDSLRALNPATLVLDAGGFFPDSPGERDDAPFVTRAMRDLGVDVAGVGTRELSFGLGWFLATVKDAGLPVVCANLNDRATGKPVLPPSLVLKAGKAKVGVFGLISAQQSLGPAADSLAVSDPAAAARGAIAALRKQGATVIVLLSSLGRTETEDLALAVEGIDVAIASRNVPVLQRARKVNATTVVMGGEQSHYVGVTELTLDAKGKVADSRSDTWMLGPEVRDQPAMAARVAEFEARPDVKARRNPPRGAAADTTGAAR